MATKYTNEGSCGECFEYITDACPDKMLTLPVGLSDGTEVSWEIENKFGQKWRGDSTVNTDEEIEISVDAFPEGMFNPHAGIFTFRALGVNGDEDELCEGIDLTICERDYSCISFSYAQITQVDSDDGGEPYGYHAPDAIIEMDVE